MSYDRVIRALEELGFTGYGARVFVTLTNAGVATASAISKVTGIPCPKVYATLGNLIGKGFVVVEAGRPKKYRVVSPEKVVKTILREEVDRLKRSVDVTVSELEPLYRRASIREASGAYSLIGRKRVLDELEELISRAGKEVFVIAPELSDLDVESVFAKLQLAADRGVGIRVVSRVGQSRKAVDRFSKVAKVRRWKDVGNEYVVVVDNEKALITSIAKPRFGTGEWSALFSPSRKCIERCRRDFDRMWKAGQ
ncbi:MAG: TrmB family transcriptional regulator [Candidatus Bathyarchaeia archaeon]